MAKVQGCKARYSKQAFLKDLNFCQSPENHSRVGTHGSGGGTTTVGATEGRSWANVVELVEDGPEPAEAGGTVKCCSRPSNWSPLPYNYNNLLTFFYGIQKNSQVLQNVSLGYHIFDSCADENKAIKSILQILSGPGETVPNYSCAKRDKIIGFIGDHYSKTTLPMAQLLGVYSYSQISYGATSHELSNKKLYPKFFRTVQNHRATSIILCKLIKFFGWTWVGILASDDDDGEKEAQELMNIMLHYFLKRLTYTKESRTHLYYDENNEFITKYFINNWIVLNNTCRIRKVGCFDPWTVDETGQFSVNVTQVFWKNSKREIPKSQCSETCLPGSRIIVQAGIHRCCYNCVSCSEGEISNKSDSENCIRCLVYEWPNEKKDLCIPRLEDFLSFRMEAITIVAISFSVLFHIKTVLIIAVFILFRDTPVVKANNKSLSFVLLVSIMLGFLCVFLFLGRPLDITCQLRQTTFAVLFSVAESSILAKTLVVCIAFKATKPGSRWQKWIGGRVPSYVVVTCSSVQMLICLLWSTLSPPYQKLDTHSYHGRIIVQCNEGSVIGFFSVLGYMGILAAVSFIIAFLARTLPDSFNEAKYITFSMLVFCSVWIAMIPAYLSTKGKYMVAVEIFAILASNAGLLGCIFYPKCYIIVCKPNLNKKISLLDNRKKVVGYIK
ncbi:vomeronasal type-2 receptor 26-like [Aquarana catesbeiana]|uniref:vomeronasal type-2 receptor 26-like n=1 Tax=Aquarana catesbeiana TaxID=8400 RepID=UPI003CCA47CE